MESNGVEDETFETLVRKEWDKIFFLPFSRYGNSLSFVSIVEREQNV